MFEVCLSRRDCHDSFLICVKRHEKEIWRSFKLYSTETAVEIFKAFDSFLHKLEHDGYELYQPETEILDQSEVM